MKNNKKKIGRNEKCPCGSEKKYKKCCLEINQHIAREENGFQTNDQELLKLHRFNEDLKKELNLISMMSDGWEKHSINGKADDEGVSWTRLVNDKGFISFSSYSFTKDLYLHKSIKSLNALSLVLIYIKNEYRGDGLGNKWMTVITELADKHQITLNLNAVNILSDKAYVEHEKELQVEHMRNFEEDDSYKICFNPISASYFDSAIDDMERSSNSDDRNSLDNKSLYKFYLNNGFEFLPTSSFAMTRDDNYFSPYKEGTKEYRPHAPSMVRIHKGEESYLQAIKYPSIMGGESSTKRFTYKQTTDFLEFIYLNDRTDLVNSGRKSKRKWLMRTK